MSYCTTNRSCATNGPLTFALCTCMLFTHQSVLPRTASMPRLSGEPLSIARASTLTMSFEYMLSSASFHACLRVSSTTFFATSSVLIFPPFIFSLVYLLNSFSGLSISWAEQLLDLCVIAPGHVNAFTWGLDQTFDFER